MMNELIFSPGTYSHVLSRTPVTRRACASSDSSPPCAVRCSPWASWLTIAGFGPAPMTGISWGAGGSPFWSGRLQPHLGRGVRLIAENLCLGRKCAKPPRPRTAGQELSSSARLQITLTARLDWGSNSSRVSVQPPE
jgi:hypothetical protein